MSFSCREQLSDHFLRHGLGIPGLSDSARIRPANVSGRRARLCAVVIQNDENPGTGPGPRGSRTGRSLVWRHTWLGGARGMKATRTRGTPRAATPLIFCDHAIRSASAHADAILRIQGVGMT